MISSPAVFHLGMLPEVMRNDHGEIEREYVFMIGDRVFKERGTSRTDAWLRTGEDGTPEREGLVSDAIKEGWYVAPKSNMSAFLEE